MRKVNFYTPLSLKTSNKYMNNRFKSTKLSKIDDIFYVLFLSNGNIFPIILIKIN
jgi:hypothetical protein